MKLRIVLNFVFVLIWHVCGVAVFGQSNGTWISPQFIPAADSPPGFMLL